MWAFRAFSDPRIHFSFEIFRSFDLNKVRKRCINAHNFNLIYTWAQYLLICLSLFGRFMCNNMCQEIFTQSIETVKLRFFVSFSVDFDKIDVFFSVFEHIRKKNLFVLFLHLNSVFPFYTLRISFSDSSSR